MCKCNRSRIYTPLYRRLVFFFFLFRWVISLRRGTQSTPRTKKSTARGAGRIMSCAFFRPRTANCALSCAFLRTGRRYIYLTRHYIDKIIPFYIFILKNIMYRISIIIFKYCLFCRFITVNFIF